MLPEFRVLVLENDELVVCNGRIPLVSLLNLMNFSCGYLVCRPKSKRAVFFSFLELSRLCVEPLLEFGLSFCCLLPDWMGFFFGHLVALFGLFSEHCLNNELFS